MRESRSYGSVRGVASNDRPYRDRRPVRSFDPQMEASLAEESILKASPVQNREVGGAECPGKSAPSLAFILVLVCDLPHPEHPAGPCRASAGCSVQALTQGHRTVGRTVGRRRSLSAGRRW